MAMAATHEHKMDHLDQPYYGPPIPPDTPPMAITVVRPPPRRDTYALLCRAFRVLTLVLIALGVVALVLWLVYQPSSLKARVDSAWLTRFDLTDGDTRLAYNLTVGVSIRNPNRKQAVMYRRLEAVAFYGGEQFGHADLPRMRQPRKSTAEVTPGFHGEGAVVSGDAAALFRREKVEGFFGIGVRLHMRVRLKVIVVDSVEYRPDVELLHQGTRPRQHDGCGAGVYADTVPCRRLLVTHHGS
ncbi:hypothetical protein HU200_026213 [Digitaria exilis]|uniref:Late embryogenesis abundant protein LEA-2 subgroup domain-containing protein n=1 Tax=Digitaria exilis TaxID=1010633 RepID=A0A835C882_9POAL|nr:hypothetical protein HU200_026213 [Digitaria exilis]